MNTVPENLTDAYLHNWIENGYHGGERNAARYFLKVPAESREMVRSEAHRFMNMNPGWNYSGSVSEVARRFNANPDKFRQDREDNSARTVEIQAWERTQGRTAQMNAWHGKPGSPIF